MVEAGAVLVRLDDRDFTAQRDQMKASVDNLIAQIEAQQAKIEQAKKQAEEAQASLTFAQQQSDRYQLLAKQGSGTVEQAQQYVSNLAAKRSVTRRRASQCGINRKTDSGAASAQHTDCRRAIGDWPKPILSRTVITAPVAGRVTHLSAAKGAYAAVGQALMMFVPRDMWVTANFKETQLDLMRPGQPVEITSTPIPTIPSKAISTVSSRQRHGVQPASGRKRHRAITSRSFSVSQSRSCSTNRLTCCSGPACRSCRR